MVYVRRAELTELEFQASEFPKLRSYQRRMKSVDRFLRVIALEAAMPGTDKFKIALLVDAFQTELRRFWFKYQIYL